MKFIASFFVFLVAFEHIYFMILEMFFWTKPKGLKAFGMKLEQAENSKVLAANQGLYNGFLAAGLIWGGVAQLTSVIIFFLICVVIAGAYSSYSTKKVKLFYIQGIPALIGLVLILLTGSIF
jgi:putative membrane protein